MLREHVEKTLRNLCLVVTGLSMMLGKCAFAGIEQGKLYHGYVFPYDPSERFQGIEKSGEWRPLKADDFMSMETLEPVNEEDLKLVVDSTGGEIQAYGMLRLPEKVSLMGKSSCDPGIIRLDDFFVGDALFESQTMTIKNIVVLPAEQVVIDKPPTLYMRGKGKVFHLKGVVYIAVTSEDAGQPSKWEKVSDMSTFTRVTSEPIRSPILISHLTLTLVESECDSGSFSDSSETDGAEGLGKSATGMKKNADVLFPSPMKLLEVPPPVFVSRRNPPDRRINSVGASRDHRDEKK